MSKYYAYIRVSTDKQTLENQKHKILEFAFNKKIQIEDFIEVDCLILFHVCRILVLWKYKLIIRVNKMKPFI